MSSNDSWRPRLNCAVAQSRDQFCFALTELEYDDPFSAIVSYDGSLPQPWSRTDVQREINAVCVTPNTSSNSSNYAALSNEGDVYLLGDLTLSEKIPGSGVLSPDANGLGAMFDVAWIDGRLWASGENAQLYVREQPDIWRKIVGPTHQASSQRISLGKMVDIDDQIHVLGVNWPRTEIQVDDQLLSNDNWDAWLNKKSTVTPRPSPQGVVFAYASNKWSTIFLPTKSILNDVLTVSESESWIVGYEGAILVGNALDGFRNIAFHGDRTKNLLSITKFRSQMIIASDYALHRFDGHILSPLKPKLNPFINKSVPTPLKVQAIDDVMFYFDYKHGVHRWDGENWEEIVIPPELMERQFKGLPSRG